MRIENKLCIHFCAASLFRWLQAAAGEFVGTLVLANGFFALLGPNLAFFVLCFFALRWVGWGAVACAVSSTERGPPCVTTVTIRVL